jgi:putative ABC transport system substrate-binding protein
MGEVSTIGLDIAKSVFQVHGVDFDGAVVIRKRISRAKLLEFFASLPSCLIGWFSAELGPKRLALLHDLLPNVTTVALLLNPNNAETARQPAELQEAARALGLQIVILHASVIGDIDGAFATFVQNRIGALVVAADSFLASRREQITTLAARHAVPAVYVNRETAGAGGLMSYGNSLADAYRRAGNHTARVLKGEKPADLPVDQATKFELIINLKTAKALGLEIPAQLLALADEVIE